MTLEEIKELIQVVQDSGVAELEVQRGENRVRIRRSVPAPHQEIVYAAAPVAAVAAPSALPAALPANSAGQQSSVHAGGATEDDAELEYVKSPIVGTFYESPSPGSPIFVNVGDRVSPGQVLCIIESMKLMNEIESEVSGVIVRKLVDNGKPVEYGQALFAVKPS